jgi:hypothetical protein
LTNKGFCVILRCSIIKIYRAKIITIDMVFKRNYVLVCECLVYQYVVTFILPFAWPAKEITLPWRQQMATSTEYKPTLDTFFAEVQRWKEWVASFEKGQEAQIERAEKRPEGARHDMNWYLDTDGRVWSSGGHILTRSSSEVLSPYKREKQEGCKDRPYKNGSKTGIILADGSEVEFIKRSCDHQDEDWTWEVKPGSLSTLSYYRSGLRSTKNGLELAALLESKRNEIKAWFDELVEEHAEFRERCPDIFNELLKEFAPEFARRPGRKSVPDNGSLSAGLSAAFDQGVFGRQVVRHCY